MAQFRGTMQGDRGIASRLGSKKNGLAMRCDGWTKGIRVVAEHKDGQDVFSVYITSGSKRYAAGLGANSAPELALVVSA